MNTNFVLVDFENVQPRNMALLKGGPFKIKVFLGASQGKISLEMAQALQTFGDDAEYIQVVGSGRNALDFHIAYYIGRLAAENPGASFSIISKDTGFDPLIKHLKSKEIDCKRSATVADIPHIRSPTLSPTKVGRRVAAAQEPATAKPAPKPKPGVRPAASPPRAGLADPALVETVLENLMKRKRALPRTVKTLRSTIHSLFKPALDEDAIAAILVELGRQGKIRIAEKNVDYELG